MLGHEGAGVVEAVGVRGLKIGDAVVLSGSSCGQCSSCHAGRPVYCADMIKLCFGLAAIMAARLVGAIRPAFPSGATLDR